ncbi:MAG: PIN domain-containing protein [Candidatus Omnitrophica bacterium]|nr:PIN domain-containing protein [Candidatus Omnitrophota bacterium]
MDTNVVVRYLAGDDPKKADRTDQLLRQANQGRIELVLTHLAIAEIIWVLSKEYRIAKERIVEGLRRLLNTPHILCDEVPLILSTLDLYESGNLSFVDAYHAAVLPSRGITEFYSYDTDFDQIPGVTRREP